MPTTNGRTLFSAGELREHLARARHRVEQALLNYDVDQLLLTPEADVTDYLVELGTVDELVLHREDAYQLDMEEITKTAQLHPGGFQIDMGPRERRVTRITVVVPFSGDAKLLELRASTWLSAPAVVDVRGNNIYIYWDADYGVPEPAVITNYVNEEISRLERSLTYTNQDVANHNKALATEVPGQVAARRAKHLANKQLQADLGFPLNTRRDAASYAIPLARKQLAPTRPPHQHGQVYTPEPTLADADYEKALDVLINSRNALERSPSTAATLSEEGIRDLLLVGLNAQFEGRAAGEVFNGAGKTDILIRVEDRNVFIAECKFWHGPKKFTEAIDQLLSYTTWRDTKAALLIFVRTGDVTAITDKAVAALAAHPNFKRHGTRADDDRRDVVLHANGDPRREIKVALMLFVLPIVEKI